MMMNKISQLGCSYEAKMKFFMNENDKFSLHFVLCTYNVQYRWQIQV